jgi:hypothetical protein
MRGKMESTRPHRFAKHRDSCLILSSISIIAPNFICSNLFIVLLSSGIWGVLGNERFRGVVPLRIPISQIVGIVYTGSLDSNRAESTSHLSAVMIG